MIKIVVSDSQVQKRCGPARGSKISHTYLSEDKYPSGQACWSLGVNPSAIQAHLPIEGPLSIRRKAP